MPMFKSFYRNESGHLVADIAKAAAAIAFLSVIAVNFLASQIPSADRDRLTEVAAAAARGKANEPLTTGTLRKAAQESKLDPCVVAR